VLGVRTLKYPAGSILKSLRFTERRIFIASCATRGLVVSAADIRCAYLGQNYSPVDPGLKPLFLSKIFQWAKAHCSLPKARTEGQGKYGDSGFARMTTRGGYARMTTRGATPE